MAEVIVKLNRDVRWSNSDVFIAEKGGGDDNPVTCIELTLGAVTEICKMYHLAKQHNLDTVSRYDYTPEWDKLTIDGDELTADISRLNVTGSGHFYWNCFVKHTNIEVFTEMMSIDDLNKAASAADSQFSAEQLELWKVAVAAGKTRRSFGAWLISEESDAK